MKLTYNVKDDKYKNVNQVLKEEFSISSRLLTKLINNNKILLNGISIDTRTCLKVNDSINVLLDLEEDNSNIMSNKMQLDIVYEDKGMLIINKPAGVAVHPSMRHYTDNLSSGVKLYFDKIGLKKKIRPVNRLDLDTSGLVVFAKNEYIQECLIKQMQENQFIKEYLCIVMGIFQEKEGTISVPIARKENSIIERCVDNNGQIAITDYQVIKEFNEFSLVKCILKTGRTHQIRVHMAYIGHPILGDTLYGSESNFISRQALHCCKLSFINPVTNKKMELKCDIPKDIDLIINNKNTEEL